MNPEGHLHHLRLPHLSMQLVRNLESWTLHCAFELPPPGAVFEADSGKSEGIMNNIDNALRRKRSASRESSSWRRSVLRSLKSEGTSQYQWEMVRGE